MIRIITDSAADLTAQEMAQPGVSVVPMSITFEDGTSVEDDGSMTKDEFFKRLATDSKLPRTSQPSPAAFMEAFADAEVAGDEVIVITVGQKLSGTYQCAVMAAHDVDVPVYVVDSETATQGEAVLLREALRLRDMGLSAQQIVEVLERFKKRIRIIAVVDSLKNLQKGGRVPAAVAIVGGLLPGYESIYEAGIQTVVTTVSGIMPLEQAMKDSESLYLDAAVRLFRAIRCGKQMNL